MQKTKQELNNELALSAGFSIVPHPKPGNPPRYQRGRVHVWRINGFRTGLHWQTAVLCEETNRYKNHKPAKTLVDALKRGEDE